MLQNMFNLIRMTLYCFCCSCTPPDMQTLYQLNPIHLQSRPVGSYLTNVHCTRLHTLLWLKGHDILVHKY